MTDADLPPRTWRRWWRELPGYWRIGARTALVLIGLHAAVGLRMAIGWIEEEAVTKFRARAVVRYFWERHGEPFRGYRFIVSSLNGRSAGNVEYVYILRGGSDKDVNTALATFPNLRDIRFEMGTVSYDRTVELCKGRIIKVEGVCIDW